MNVKDGGGAEVRADVIVGGWVVGVGVEVLEVGGRRRRNRGKGRGGGEGRRGGGRITEMNRKRFLARTEQEEGSGDVTR